MKTTDAPIIVEDKFKTSIEKVWSAITNKNEMVMWYFDNIPDFRPEVGFRTEFNVISGERSFLHKWHITEVIPKKKIIYNWRYEGYKGSADVCFQLSDLEGKVKLELTVIVLEDFPDDIPEFKRESCIGGWEYFVKERLKEYLE